VIVPRKPQPPDLSISSIVSTSASDPMDFDNKVAEGITHLDDSISSSLLHSQFVIYRSLFSYPTASLAAITSDSA